LDTAIVTGSSTGLGRAIALQLCADYNVVVNAKTDVEGGHRTVREIAERDGTAVFVQADLSTSAGVDKALTAARLAFGTAHVLVNNAGATRGETFGLWADSHWHDMLTTNLVSCALMSQAFVAQLGDDAGAIVNIASIRGIERFSRIGAAAYCAAKAGVINLTGALARQLAPRVTVNAVSPGFVATAYLQRAHPAMVAGWLDATPIERFVDPQEVARVVTFLISEREMTGANIVVDGGFTTTSV
jgi:NAD(P)-dependent dehydrogenase (short-subunit alcohol dehydrogenase family)